MAAGTLKCDYAGQGKQSCGDPRWVVAWLCTEDPSHKGSHLLCGYHYAQFHWVIANQYHPCERCFAPISAMFRDFTNDDEEEFG